MVPFNAADAKAEDKKGEDWRAGAWELGRSLSSLLGCVAVALGLSGDSLSGVLLGRGGEGGTSPLAAAALPSFLVCLQGPAAAAARKEHILSLSEVGIMQRLRAIKSTR